MKKINAPHQQEYAMHPSIISRRVSALCCSLGKSGKILLIAITFCIVTMNTSTAIADDTHALQSMGDLQSTSDDALSKIAGEPFRRAI